MIAAERGWRVMAADALAVGSSQRAVLRKRQRRCHFLGAQMPHLRTANTPIFWLRLAIFTIWRRRCAFLGLFVHNFLAWMAVSSGRTRQVFSRARQINIRISKGVVA